MTDWANKAKNVTKQLHSDEEDYYLKTSAGRTKTAVSTIWAVCNSCVSQFNAALSDSRLLLELHYDEIYHDIILRRKDLVGNRLKISSVATNAPAYKYANGVGVRFATRYGEQIGDDYFFSVSLSGEIVFALTRLEDKEKVWQTSVDKVPQKFLSETMTPLELAMWACERFVDRHLLS